MKLCAFNLTSLLALFAAAGAFAAEIPDRPEKLSFPPLTYEPPVAGQARVQLAAGPVVYLLPDRERPLINLTLYIRAGTYLEPAGKEGLADLCGWLLAHGGAGTNSAETLDERLAFLAADLDVSINRTEGNVNLNLLSKDLDEGFALLRDILYFPRFQADKVTLRQAQLLQDIKQRNDQTSSIEAREVGFLARGENFFENRYATSNSLTSITQQDLKAFHQKWFTPQNFVVGVSGDFDRETMIAKLEKLFALPTGSSSKPPSIPTNFSLAAPGVYLINKPEVDQGRVTMLLPGIRRDDPDYIPGLIMNHILGGGGFSSRLMGRVRSDEGLAYSVFSRFPGGVYYPGTISIGFQSKSRTVAYAAALCVEEIKKLAAEPITPAELRIAQQSFINTFPQKFATKTAVADVFASEEFTGRYASDPQFWKTFRDRISAVTAADVQRVAKKFLTPEKLVILVVGNRDDILLGHPNHPQKLTDLGGGKFTELPLRDPLTMQPLK